jgi:hypothetical protein
LAGFGQSHLSSSPEKKHTREGNLILARVRISSRLMLSVLWISDFQFSVFPYLDKISGLRVLVCLGGRENGPKAEVPRAETAEEG